MDIFVGFMVSHDDILALPFEESFEVEGKPVPRYSMSNI